MRRTFTAWGFAIFIAMSGLTCTSAAVASSSTGVSVSFFYGQLRPYGTWVSHPRYGYVWHPRGVPHGWRPYTHGRWAWTTEHGWTWVSYYNWGWAPFHYGRWSFDPGYGWYWVPGTVWGPAWVAWRMGDGFIGWYPLSPGTHWRARVGLVYSGVDIYAAYYTPHWVFVPARYFLSRRLQDVVVHPQHNFKFVRYTNPMTRYAQVRGRIVNWSIPRQRIEHLTRRRVVPMQVRVFHNRRHWRHSGRSARQLRVFRPQLGLRSGPYQPPRIGSTPRWSPRGDGPQLRHGNGRGQPPHIGSTPRWSPRGDGPQLRHGSGRGQPPNIGSTPHWSPRRDGQPPRHDGEHRVRRPSKKQSAEGHSEYGTNPAGPQHRMPRRRPGR